MAGAGCAIGLSSFVVPCHHSSSSPAAPGPGAHSKRHCPAPPFSPGNPVFRPSGCPGPPRRVRHRLVILCRPLSSFVVIPRQPRRSSQASLPGSPFSPGNPVFRPSGRPAWPGTLRSGYDVYLRNICLFQHRSQPAGTGAASGAKPVTGSRAYTLN